MIKWSWEEHKSTPTEAQIWQQALAIPLLAPLDETERQKLTQLAKCFLQQKHLTPLQDLILDEIKSARVALLFCLPILELGIVWFDGFYEVIIYPQPIAFDKGREDDVGRVHHSLAMHSDRGWQQGPIILNWPDIKDSFDDSGFNLIIHEVAHRLDMRNGGYASGIPLTRFRDIAGWEWDLHNAMNHIQDEIDLVGKEASSIDAYAAVDPAECFAVLSEYFFSAPQLFAPRFSSLYQRFCQFYQQDPMQRLLVIQKQNAESGIIEH